MNQLTIFVCTEAQLFTSRSAVNLRLKNQMSVYKGVAAQTVKF